MYYGLAARAETEAPGDGQRLWGGSSNRSIDI
jgi:hypothetical protein